MLHVSQFALKPIARQRSNLFERAWLFKKMSCARNNLKLLFFHAQLPECVFVHGDHRRVLAPDNQ